MSEKKDNSAGLRGLKDAAGQDPKAGLRTTVQFCHAGGAAAARQTGCAFAALRDS